MSFKKKVKNAIRTVIYMFKDKRVVAVPQMVNYDKQLEGKVALITGGSSGIGFEIARKFLDNGCKVIIAGRSKSKLEQACNSLANNDIKYIELDVSNVKSLESAVEKAASLFEENRIDILVNSAGVLNKSGFKDMTEEEWDSIMNTNAKGTYFMCQAVSKFMIKHKVKGHILNLSSASSIRPAWTPYQVSKWAIRGMTLGIADELIKHGIVVNAIAPGPVATPMMGKEEGDTIYLRTNPAERYAIPEEIADLAMFMVSDRGNLIVGDTFYITGGGGTISLHH